MAVGAWIVAGMLLFWPFVVGALLVGMHYNMNKHKLGGNK